ncbi:TonB-dependent receptor plug domain-containing protein [Bacteroides gallinaceum]|uniref:TonB-dependent receptor n=2 Tax=Bacteroidaceae TaxID=815 RepID=A0ABT7VFB7_9BACE|nr:TonB-dependent receptor [Bacteroides gallinaceum]MBU3855185.1 TonB-dependent receptor [Candidatus Phocaeicola excrementipullorum]MDM8324991.1 TonB-dependent receptor [Bacteroides gallinaceum]
MKKENFKRGSSAVRFKRFSRRPYAVFISLKVEVTIGVLSAAMLTFANVDSVSAQTENHAKEKLYELGEVEVTGTRVPMTVSQAARMVTVLDRDDIAAVPAQSVNDLLKYAVGIDVRQRGDMGVQTDISIRGGTFDQITILLNGINICDPQTGHNAADFPVDISEIERIEVLEGPAGRVYGTSSLVGAINIVTRPDLQSGMELRAEGGSYGFFDGGGHINLTKGAFSNQFSGGFSRSDGFSRNAAGRLNSDFKQAKAFYQGGYAHEKAEVRWHAGFTQKDYGANTFYSAKYDDQFEHTRKYYTAVQAETKGDVYRFKPSVYWNRSEDRFELVRNRPETVPFNYHRTDVYGLNLNNTLETALGKTAFGAEFRNEGIVSTTLGEPLHFPEPAPGGGEYTAGLNRTNLSFHLEHNILLRGFTLSAGVIAVKNTGNEMNFRFYPGVDASWQFARDWKLYASFNTSLRMPTFTELYYSVNGYKADRYLKPEEMKAYEIGVKYLTPGIRGTVSLFHYRGTNLIDWIKDLSEGADAPWQSVNHAKVNTTGVETSLDVSFDEMLHRTFFIRNLTVSYAYIDQDKKSEPDVQSRYALEYLRHKVVAQANLRVWRNLNLNVSYRWQDRMGNYEQNGEMVAYEPYSLLDARLSWDTSSYRVYAEANNLLNRTYYDYGNIPQPGIWVRAGAVWRLKW